MHYQIDCFHGFLGKPQDWTNLFASAAPKCYECYSHDLFNVIPITSLSSWAHHFSKTIQERKDDGIAKRVLMGYSLGGRLALHVLLADPSLWDAAIIISSHPGLQCNSDRSKRLSHDIAWANKFANEEWSSLIDAWNGQKVFESSKYHFECHPADFERQHLAQALRDWSLGKQEDLRKKINRVDIPILWMSGEHDLKFRDLSEEISLSHPASRKVVVPNAGHRLPWEQPDTFFDILVKFLTLEPSHADSHVTLVHSQNI